MVQTKTLDELEKKVIDTQAGLMSIEDLRVLFEGDQLSAAPVTQTPQEPIVTTTPITAVTTPAPIEPATTVQPTPAPKPEKDIEELKIELQKARQDKDDALRLYNSMLVAPQPVEPIVQSQEPVVAEDDDTVFFEKPTEASRKIARQEAVKALVEYNQSLLEGQKRMGFVAEFKSQHTDFDSYREDMAAILRARPDLDKNYTNLPMVYEMAKQRYRMRLEKMRVELGITGQPTVAPTPVTSQPAVDETALIEKVKNVIAEEIRKRRNAAGVQGGSTPASPADRTEPIVKVTPKTPTDLVFEEMMNSGPNILSLESDGIKVIPK